MIVVTGLRTWVGLGQGERLKLATTADFNRWTVAFILITALVASLQPGLRKRPRRGYRARHSR
jgi:hypothetical protein